VPEPFTGFMRFVCSQNSRRARGLAIALLLTCALVVAQTNSSAIEGRVADPAGAAVANCTVVLKNLQTGTSVTSQTNEAGSFFFPSVPVGYYTLTVTKENFKTYELSNFRIAVDQRATFDVALELGAVAESVTVEAAGSAPLLEVVSNEMGTVIEPVNVSQLPLNGRHALQLGYLSGAAQDGGPTSTDFLATQTGHAYRDITITGIEQDLIGFTVNGISVAGSRLGDLALDVSIGAVDQFKVVQGFIMPTMGPSAGIVTVVTKSGSNSLHGEVFEFLRNNAFDARNFFEAQAQPGPFRRNQFGAAVGGPVKRNKVFFFATYEGLRETQATVSTGFAPTSAMFGGDFSAIPATIYDPATFSAETGQRQAFAGNVIPPSRINETSQKLLTYYLPGSSYASRPSNVFGEPVRQQTADQGSARVDVTLNQNNTLFGQYMHEVYPVTRPGLFPVSGLYYDMNTEYAMVQWTSAFTPHVVNEMHAGFTRPYLFYGGIGADGIESSLPVTGTADGNGVPGITLGGFSSFGTAQSIIGNIDNHYQLYDSLKILHGKHEIAVGFGLTYMRTTQESANWNARGTIVFNSVFTAQLAPSATGVLAPVAGSGSSFADFLLGMPVNGTVTSMPRTHYRWTEVYPYVQDTWRVTPTFTLNFGLGWYVGTPPNPSGSDRNYPHAFDRATGEVLYAALGKISPQIYSTDWNNLSPRLGFAWQPKFWKGTVIRGGAGLYYPAMRALYDLFGITAPGVSIVQSIANSTATSDPRYLMGKNVFPPMTQVPITEEFAKNVTGTILALDQYLKTPYTEQWNVSIQHAFGRSLVGEIAYVGSQSRSLPVRWNIDDCSVPNSLVCDPAARPWKRYSYVYFAGNEGFGNYNALTARVQREFSNGVSFLANYTWSKAISDTMQGGANTPLNQRGVCVVCDKGLTAFNSPQRLAVATVWALPIGRDKRLLGHVSPLVNHIVGGWAVNAIATFSAGNPFTVNAPNNTVAPLTNFRANRLCSGRSELQNQDVRSNGLYWFSPACFAAPAAGYFGNSGVNIITGPGVNNWDLGLEKAVQLNEELQLQFRAEFFNAWNHAQFLNPNQMVGDPNFGQLTQARDPRILQLGLKLLW
jgi:hypothetical protein